MPEEKTVSRFDKKTKRWVSEPVGPGHPDFRILDTTTEPKPHSVQAAEEDEEAEERKE